MFIDETGNRCGKYDYFPGDFGWAAASEQVNIRRLLLLSEEEHNTVLWFRDGHLNIVGDQLCTRK